jgi:hypothetical protein
VGVYREYPGRVVRTGSLGPVVHERTDVLFMETHTKNVLELVRSGRHVPDPGLLEKLMQVLRNARELQLRDGR